MKKEIVGSNPASPTQLKIGVIEMVKNKEAYKAALKELKEEESKSVITAIKKLLKEKKRAEKIVSELDKQIEDVVNGELDPEEIVY